MINKKYKILTSVYVNNYFFRLKKLCYINNHIIKAKLSFTLYGNFLQASHYDSIKYTCDYYQFCLFIKNILEESYSCEHKNIKSEIKKKALNFSPLITNGYLEIKLLCHTNAVIRIFLK